MTTFFKPYEGTRPFFFISYAHRQSDAVVNTIRLLHEKGWRLWYDEGIPAGSDWPANIARHMQSCERVIFFLSARAMESSNCYSEMRTAARLKKPTLIVRLEDVEIEARWRELLDGCNVIPLCADEHERAEAILRSGFLARRFHHSWTERIPWRVLVLAASLLLFFGAAGALAAMVTGRWTPIPPPEPPVPQVTPASSPSPTPPPVVDLGEAERFFAVSFPDRQTERAIRRALDIPEDVIYRWQIAEIQELYFCGNMVINSLSPVTFDADGTCYVNGAKVAMGQVSDLSLLVSAVRLRSLALICQPLRSLSYLSGHVLLRELSLAGSSVDSLNAVSELPSLETLHLEHTNIQDLTHLQGFSHLKTVTVSRDMLPLTWATDASFKVILVNES